MNTLRVALVQLALAWEQPKKNRHACATAIDTLVAPADLIVLPETFATGFTMQPDRVAESMTGETLTWMQKVARQHSSTLCGSLAIRANGVIRNRFVWVRPKQAVLWYDKHHLFGLAGEDQRYRSGDKRVIVPLDDISVRPLICYDLRFPGWCRATDGEQLQIYVANWPRPRYLAWRQLLRARAIENQCYVIGVNRCGDDGRGNQYLGGSMVVDYLGKTLVDAGETPGVCHTSLDISALEKFRSEFPFLPDRDRFHTDAGA